MWSFKEARDHGGCQVDADVRHQYEILYIEFPDQYGLRYLIDQAAEELQRETDGRFRLREDGRYLLLINFTAMVIGPAERAGKVPAGELRESAGNDIRIILRLAAATRSIVRSVPVSTYAAGAFGGAAAAEIPAEEISGHQVVNALTSVWGDLKTMAYNVWD
jgi:hypothetical protein